MQDFSSGVTAISTVVLTVCTWFLYVATKRMAVAMREPHVVVTIEPNRTSSMHADLLVQNTGPGPAYDVQLKFEPPLKRLRGDKEDDLPFNPIPVLRPGQSIRNYIGEATIFLKLSYKTTISWKDFPHSKSRKSNIYNLNFAHYENLAGRPEPLDIIAKELEKIRDRLAELGKRSNKINVDIYTNDDRVREWAELEQHWNSQNPVAVEEPSSTDPPSKMP